MASLGDKEQVLAHWRSKGVGDGALEDLYTLALAVASNDARAEEHQDPAPVTEAEGWNREAVEYMQEQRGLRITALVQGGLPALQRAMAGHPIQPDPTLSVATRLAWIDGFNAAATAIRERKSGDQ